MARKKKKSKKNKRKTLTGKKMKPKGKKGKIAVKRLGRTYKTGGFEKLKRKVEAYYRKKGYSAREAKELGEKTAAAVYWKMVKKRKGK